MDPARAIAHAVRSGRTSAAEVARAALAAAAACRSNAFVTLATERALAAAAAVDAAIAAGRDPGPLAGVPFAAKDNIATRGVTTTAGSAILRDYVPPFDATVIERLERAGAVLIGKTNQDEFGMGSSSETSCFGPVRHPHAPERVAGGSSGGSAVAVAEGVVPIALGTDTGGSVRQPAAFCGVFGFKPTYGRVSRSGVIAYASSLDQVGVISHDAHDAALALAAIAGRDPRDATTYAAPASDDLAAVTVAEASLAGVRIGRVVDLMGAGVQEGVRAAVDAHLERCKARGAVVIDVHLPLTEAAVAAYYLIATAEASSNLARYDGTLHGLRVGASADGHESVARSTRAQGFSVEVRRRVLMGSFALSAGYADAYAERAARVRRRIAEQIEGAFAQVDALVAPTAPTVAWRLGERSDDPLSMYVADVTTCLANLAGLPAMSIPAGVGEAELPVGAQWIGPAWSERRLLGYAVAASAHPC
jgi:aspartyl-tRNA(Asn)/glutamyl-tRNA(Gln) amidotransferase subunit A